MKIEQQREEIILCMVKQGFFNLERYEKEMKKLKQTPNFPSIYKEILKIKIYGFIRDEIDNIINEIK